MPRRSLVVLDMPLVIALVGLLFGLAGMAEKAPAAGALANPPLCVYRYSGPNSRDFLALAVRGDTVRWPAHSVHDHVILVGTSASQSGQYRQRQMDVLNGYLQTLSNDDQVKLYAFDVKPVAMMEHFAAPTSDACRKAADSLATRTPLGASDLLAALRAAMADLPAGRPGTIVCLADGMSAAHLSSPTEVATMCAELRNRQVTINSFAVGPQTDLELLGTLAQLTGGVVLFDSTGSPTQIKGSDLAVAAKAPVAYPSRLVVEPKSVELLPNVALPIRGDRHTIYLGKGKAPERLQMTLEFPADTHLSPLTLSGEVAAQRKCGPVLAFLWQRAEASHGVIDPLAGTRLLAGVENAFEDRLSAMLDKGERAIAGRDAVAGEQAGQFVRALDPNNARAATLLAAAENLRKESAAKETRQIAQASHQASSEATPPVPPVPGAGSNPGKLELRAGMEQQSPVAKYRQLMAIRGQELTQEVNSAITEARRMGHEDPDAGIASLKRAENVVTTAADVEPQVRDQLVRRLHTTMQELRSVRERQSIEHVKNAERLAQIESRQRSLEQMSVEETRLTQLIDQVRALLVQAVHGDDPAYEEAEAVAREALNLRPGNGPATQAVFDSEAAGQLNKAYRLRNLRADRLLEALYLVELAHVPFPDEPPIQWPSAQTWRALTERRKKWSAVDIRTESKSEQRINEALDKDVDFSLDPQPLKEAMDFISKRYNFPIIIDNKALEEASVEPTAEVKMDVPGIKLRNMLKLLLEQTPQPLTYVIEDEVMKITTVEKAKEMVSIRMYPVGDLLLGPQQLQMMSRMGGGMMGGMRGGMGGGMGGMGGGMGGMGGGMGMGGMGGGMMGGGMFSVPSK